MGAEMVQITMTKPGYPEEVLRKQIAELGVQLQSDPRGLVVKRIMVRPGEPGYLRADFAMDHLIEPNAVRIWAVLKSLVGNAEPHQVRFVTCMLEGVEPNQELVRVYRKAGVVNGVGRAFTSPRGIEYQIELLSQDPKVVDFPERYTPSGPSQEVERGREVAVGASPMLIIGLFAVAGLALGALVYLLLLRSGPKARS